MPRQKTRDTSPLYIEMENHLLEKLKELAQRNRRKLKAELTLAIERHLTESEQQTLREIASADTTLPASRTIGGDARSAPSPGRPTAGRPPLSSLADASVEVYKKILARLKTNPDECAIAGQLRLGVTYAQIFASNPGEDDAIIKKINKIMTTLEAVLSSQ